MPFDFIHEPAPQKAATEWRQAAEQNTRRISKVVYDVVTAPSVLIGAGVSIWSYQTSGIPGLLFNSGIATTSAVLCAYESWTGRKRGWPGGVRAVTSLISAGLVLLNHVDIKPIHHALESALPFLHHTDPKPIRTASDFIQSVALPVASNLLAAGGWYVQGTHEKHATQPKATLDDPLFYAGLCEIPAAISIVGLSARVAPFFAAVGKAMMKKPDESHIIDSWRDMAIKHVTPARLCALGYGLCAAATGKHDIAATSFQLLWTSAFALWDKKENHDFVPDLKRLIKGHSAVPAP